MRRIGIVVTLALLAGCAPVMYRTAPDYQARALDIGAVALMPLDVKVYRMPANLNPELVGEWSEEARAHLDQSISKRLGTDRSLVRKGFDEVQSPTAQQEYEDIRPMFEAVARSVLAHCYGPEHPSKKDLLGYSLGPLPALREATGTDALLFVYAVDHVLTFGRHMVNLTLAALMAAARIPVGGGFTAPMPVLAGFGAGRDPNLVVATLVDSQTGDMLWFTWRHWESGKIGVHDLRKASSAESLADEIFDDLAASRRK